MNYHLRQVVLLLHEKGSWLFLLEVGVSFVSRLADEYLEFGGHVGLACPEHDIVHLTGRAVERESW